LGRWRFTLSRITVFKVDYSRYKLYSFLGSLQIHL